MYFLSVSGICCFSMNSITLCLLCNLSRFCPLLFFQDHFFFKNSFRNTIRVENSLDPYQARQKLGMIWVQTVCKGYQQTTLVVNEDNFSKFGSG